MNELLMAITMMVERPIRASTPVAPPTVSVTATRSVRSKPIKGLKQAIERTARCATGNLILVNGIYVPERKAGCQ